MFLGENKGPLAFYYQSRGVNSQSSPLPFQTEAFSVITNSVSEEGKLALTMAFRVIKQRKVARRKAKLNEIFEALFYKLKNIIFLQLRPFIPNKNIACTVKFLGNFSNHPIQSGR